MDFDRDMVSKSLAKGTATSGVDIELVRHISENVSIPCIAASGAKKVEHFSDISEKTDVEAPLTAGIFQTEGRSADWGCKGTYEGARNRASLNNDTISVHLKSLSR